jgi:hypothetical protein
MATSLTNKTVAGPAKPVARLARCGREALGTHYYPWLRQQPSNDIEIQFMGCWRSQEE